ncbi:MAG: hypothetical protein IT566_05540 [Rhodospirillaceae bacterium]|nr:hypothetical protein [Rhodospirillaceae bacterium]
MDRKARTFAQLLVAALIIMTGTGFYAFSLRDRLDDTVESFGALEQDRNQWKSKAETAEGLIDGASASLDQCSAQVDELKSRLAVGIPSPNDPRS